MPADALAFPYGEAPACRHGPPHRPQTIDYTYDHFERMLDRAIDCGYGFASLATIARGEIEHDRLIVLRHDIDEQPERVLPFSAIEARRGIAGTFFFRASANEYNLFGYRTKRVIAILREQGHEVGLHTEPVDIAAASSVSPLAALKEEIATFRLAVGDFDGVASHNDSTPYNNLTFLQTADSVAALAQAGLYEAYSVGDLFDRSVYATDSYRYFWRVFRAAALSAEHHCVCDLLDAIESPLYLLIHPHLWYSSHYHHGTL